MLFRSLGADKVAAFFCEPVQGSGGVIVPPKGWLKAMREACRELGILFVVDEVITGFGRTGRWFALERFGVQPDILSIAKAITSGYVPMGAFIVSGEIMSALQQLPTDARFMHAYTNSAHPPAAIIRL